MYLDVYFFVNLIMDRLSLACALREYRMSGWRLWLGAFIGAVGACLCEMIGLAMLLRPAVALIIAGCMLYSCIGKRPFAQWIRALIEVYGYSFLFAGVIPYISRFIPLWLGSVLVSYSGIRAWLWWQTKRKRKIVTVIFEVGSVRKKLMAMVDTGHRLAEPITGKPVVIIRKECLPKMVDPQWPICFESVQGTGVMFGCWPEKLWIEERRYKEKEILVAVAAEWGEKTWDALVPGYVIE